jgi:hypothetical protein
MPEMPNTTCTGEVTVSPSFGLTMNTVAPAGAGVRGRAGTAAA